jgi:hypothetical protein
MTYYFAQLVTFRPLLHYLRVMADGGTIPRTQSYHALACIKLASSTIQRSCVLLGQGDILPGSWVSIHTIFLSVMCLIFLIAAHQGTWRPTEAWQRASLGIRIIIASKCADDCSKTSLEVLKVRQSLPSSIPAHINNSRWLFKNCPTQFTSISKVWSPWDPRVAKIDPTKRVSWILVRQWVVISPFSAQVGAAPFPSWHTRLPEVSKAMTIVMGPTRSEMRPTGC